jgi:hypothetical protein
MTETDYSHRLIAIETRLPYFKEDLDNLYFKIDALDKSFNGIDKKLEILVSQKNDAEKRLARFKTAGLTLCTALALALIGWLARIAMVVQTAKLVSN